MVLRVALCFVSAVPRLGGLMARSLRLTLGSLTLFTVAIR